MSDLFEDTLADLLQALGGRGRAGARRGAERKRAVLALGESCASAAGVPDLLEIARMVFEDSDLAAQYLTQGDLEDDDDLLHGIQEYLEEMTSAQRQRMLQSFYDPVPVPVFYQDLALLVKAGYFSIILTTSLDTLLEKALSNAGLWAGMDFSQLNLVVPGPDNQEDLDEVLEAPICILKFPGLGAGKQTGLAGRIAELNHRLRAKIGADPCEIVVAGYEFENEALNRLLADTRGRFWWVNTHKPHTRRLRRLAGDREVRLIGGPTAMPETFFSRLVYHLIRQPWIKAATPSTEILRDQLDRSRALLKDLEQRLPPGEQPASQQLAYQRKQVAALEDEWRSLEPTSARLLELVEGLVQVVQSSKASQETRLLAYLETQAQAIQQEYQQSQPNQALVSAAVSALLVLAERLGAEIVPGEIVRELAEYAPSEPGWKA